MNIYRWNGEYWYHDKRNWLKRLRQWIIWIGGWEKPNGAGWCIFKVYKGEIKTRNFHPLSLLGHRITFYTWGFQVRLRIGWFVLAYGKRCYISKDGTPNGAFIWYYGAPSEIVRAAKQDANP